MRQRGISRIYLYPSIFMVAVIGLAVIRVVAWRHGTGQDDPISTTAPAPATLPATLPTTEPVEKPRAKLADLLSVIHADQPDYPTTQPLESEAELVDAGKIILERPIYLDMAGRLWITHSNGTALEELLRKGIRSNTLVVDSVVRYVHYPLSGKPGVFIDTTLPGQIERVTDRRRDTFVSPADNRWTEASRFGNDVVVPNDRGVMIYSAGDPGPQNPRTIDLWNKTPLPPERNAAVLLSTGDSFLTWIPTENGRLGAAGAMYVDAKGERRLNATTDWFDPAIHYMPLADGSILGIGRSENGVQLKLTPLDAPPPPSVEKAEQIKTLARKLADRDPLVREKTQRELEQLGPSIHAQLEAMRETLPAEAQVRIETLLGQRFAPTLAGLRPLDGEVQTVARFPDGGCVLVLTGGGIETIDGEDKTLIPAWIAIRPGLYLERLAPRMIEGFVPGKYKLFAFGSEWVAFDPVLGPRRWMGSTYITLLPKPLRHFDTFVGVDRPGRWIFRASSQPGKTLILDPSLPDPTPRLPVWQHESEDGVGWTDAGWPTVKRGDKYFVLGEKGWRILDDKTEKFQDTPPNVLPTLAADTKGVQYELKNSRVLANGSSIIEDAGNATGLFVTNDRLFLSIGGSIARHTLSGKREAVFTKRLPTTDVDRVWLDPANRIVVVAGKNMYVTFPTGRVPKELSSLILQSTREDEDEVEEKPE